MLLKPEPLFEAVESVLGTAPSCPVILLTPQGKSFRQAEAERLALEPTIALLCGHYGGVDERVRKHLATEELSIGDYVLTGGELAAMVVVDAVARLIPGVLGSEEAAAGDSYASGLLQHLQYTRPPEFRGWRVPRCSSPAITRPSHDGGGARRYCAPCIADPTSWIAHRCLRRSGACWRRPGHPRPRGSPGERRLF